MRVHEKKYINKIIKQEINKSIYRCFSLRLFFFGKLTTGSGFDVPMYKSYTTGLVSTEVDNCQLDRVKAGNLLILYLSCSHASLSLPPPLKMNMTLYFGRFFSAYTRLSILAKKLAFSSIILLSAKSFIKLLTSVDQFIMYIGLGLRQDMVLALLTRHLISNKIICGVGGTTNTKAPDPDDICSYASVVKLSIRTNTQCLDRLLQVFNDLASKIIEPIDEVHSVGFGTQPYVAPCRLYCWARYTVNSCAAFAGHTGLITNSNGMAINRYIGKPVFSISENSSDSPNIVVLVLVLIKYLNMFGEVKHDNNNTIW
ncbi:hypothetical protein AGLY_014748 [Aphis glycines]|uniref:Uncharacterized protein n=1 Tax=Aphis glycines TaxID=307491 RepID=A0A6G0T2R7_APHGL|nr:hypothetical protein AGLY_014748 [Aphis glycines]